MKNRTFQEDFSSQLPALRLLQALGYTYLSQDKVMDLRQQRTSNVLLEDILKEQLAKINIIQVSSSRTEKFNQANIEEAIIRLKEIPFEQGYGKATEFVYELLCLGTTLEQEVDGYKRGHTLQFIDWKRPENNVFHVAEEFSVSTADGRSERRPDIVLFVNGIPLSIIENKRQDMDNPIGQAISQHLRNQQPENIRRLYVYAQLMISCAVNDAKYATNGTRENFWSRWTEQEFTEENLSLLKDKTPPKDAQQAMMTMRSKSPYFNKEQAEHIHSILNDSYAPTEQDKLLHGITTPKRLLDLIKNFIVYDAGIKKVARYQQYFAVNKAMAHITDYQGGARKGGVIWHTQGSGKSLTMGMLAKAIAEEPSISNPKIVLVTDRTDLDRQITKTFQNVGLEVINAKTGKHLVEQLESNTDAVITTIINKFETAVKRIKEPLTSPNIFVLIDEGHRSQHGTFNINMHKVLPNASFIAFTGTPLFKKDKNTIHKFGGMIDQYTVKEAVEDEAVLPLLYEGRYTEQTVEKKIIDNYFSRISEPLTDLEKADLKRKFSSKTHISDADKNIYAIAWDISLHYEKNFQGSKAKAQVVCSRKDIAVKYYKYFQEIGKVNAALIISPPDDREGEETAYGGTTDEVKKFWASMIDQHSNAKEYENNIISQFKNDKYPEVIIVVDKLLTGFDAPINTVLYLTRKLKGHTLLQAIARVNRLYPDKTHGYIIDYAGVIQELDSALLLYSTMEDFDDADLEGTLVSINEEILKLDASHQAVLEFFKHIKNKRDVEQYQLALSEQDIRDDFYKKLAQFARILKIALSSIAFHKTTSEEKIKLYKEDVSFFMNLRTAVARRYSDKIDYKVYEGQIQKLIDQHITTHEVEKLTELVNIFDKEAFEEELRKIDGDAARADTIASRTSKHITEKMEEDPAFYKKFSQLIEQAIADFYSERISELEYLERVKSYSNNVLSKSDSTIPEQIRHNGTASAYYGILNGAYQEKELVGIEEDLANASLHIFELIESMKRVNWKNDSDVLKQMVLKIGDYLHDEVNPKLEVKMSFSDIDTMAEELVDIAKTRD